MESDVKGQEFSRALAAEIKWNLAHIDMSTSHLSRRLNIERKNISNWLSGATKIPISFCYSASRAAGFSLPALVDAAEERMKLEDPLPINGHVERTSPSDLAGEVLNHRAEVFADCMAAELKTLLQREGITAKELASKLGNSSHSVGSWLNGRSKMPLAFAYDASQLVDEDFSELVVRAERGMVAELLADYESDNAALSAETDPPGAAVSAQEIGRRIRDLLTIENLTVEAGYSRIVSQAAKHDSLVHEDELLKALSGESLTRQSTLTYIEQALSAPNGFLTTTDREVADHLSAAAELAQAAAELAQVAADKGVMRIATRGVVSAESMREIAALVNKYVSE